MARIDPETLGGFYIEEAEEEEAWDYDIDEARYKGTHAEETLLHQSYLDFEGFATFEK